MNEIRAKEIRKDKAREEGRAREIPRDLQWLCTSCGFMLGFVNRDKTEIRMKARDFFVTVEGGKLTHPCRNCGQLNELMDDGYLLWASQKKSLDEFLANRKLFVEFLKQKKDFAKFLISRKKESEMKKETQVDFLGKSNCKIEKKTK